RDARLVDLRARLDERPGLTQVPLLTPAELATLKQTTVVRTPADFTRQIAIAVLLFVGAFWAGHLVLRSMGRSPRARTDAFVGGAQATRTDGDPLLLPTLMMLSGVGMMTMIALRDPLRDTVMAGPFAQGVAAGIVLLVGFSAIDFEASSLRRAFG